MASAYAAERPDNEPSVGHLSDAEARLKAITDRPDNGDWTARVRLELGETMDSHLAVFRDESGMQAALATVRELKERHQALPLRYKGRIYNTDLIFHLELGYMLDVAETIVVGGLARKESRGAHFRRDMPERNDQEWLRHTVVTRADSGPVVDYLPVTVTRWEPEARVY